jgi:hypothetical protein
MADITYFKTEMESATRERAKAVGMDYEGVLKVCGVNNSVWDNAKKLYKVHCKRDGYDSGADIGAMKTDNYNKLCVGFMLNADTYRIAEPPKAVADAPKTPNQYENVDDVRLAIDNLSAKMDVQNQILRDIRNSLSQKPTTVSNAEVVGKLDKIIHEMSSISVNTMNLSDIKKSAHTVAKLISSVDARLGGINQIVASHRIEVGNIKGFVERWVSGK